MRHRPRLCTYRNRKPACRRPARGIPKDRLHSEKAVTSGFRTGVRFPPAPPNKRRTPIRCPSFICRGGIDPRKGANIAHSAIRSDKATVRWTVAPFVQPSVSEGEQTTAKLFTTAGLLLSLFSLPGSTIHSRVKREITRSAVWQKPLLAMRRLCLCYNYCRNLSITLKESIDNSGYSGYNENVANICSSNARYLLFSKI